MTHVLPSLTGLAWLISATDPTGSNLLQYGIPAVLSALVGGLVWVTKWMAGQLAEQGKAMIAISERATTAMATQAETNRSVAGALQTIANRQEVAAQVAAQVAAELEKTTRGGGNRRTS